METKIHNAQGEEVGSVPLQDRIFGVKPRAGFLHEAVTVQLANRRTGSANTKTRAEVSGSGKKPWKQKHTGRARAGSLRSPLWRHGGVTFGPRAHEIERAFPRRKRRLALAQALSAKAQAGGLILVDKMELDEPKTKLLAAALTKLKCAGRTVLVLDRSDANLTRAGRNIPGLELALEGDLNAYMVLRSRQILMTRAALDKLTTRWN